MGSNTTTSSGLTIISGVLTEYSGSSRDVSVTNGVRCIGSAVFSNNGMLRTVSLPGSVEALDKRCFENCICLESVNLPDGIRTIGDHAFSGCSKLAVYTLPASLEAIGPYAFRDCQSLKSISIPEGTKEIGIGAFMNCRGLKSIHIPPDVTSFVCAFGITPFTGCDDLTIYALSGSAADKFAAANNINVITAPVVKSKDAAQSVSEDHTITSGKASSQQQNARAIQAASSFGSGISSKPQPFANPRRVNIKDTQGPVSFVFMNQDEDKSPDPVTVPKSQSPAAHQTERWENPVQAAKPAKQGNDAAASANDRRQAEAAARAKEEAQHRAAKAEQAARERAAKAAQEDQRRAALAAQEEQRRAARAAQEEQRRSARAEREERERAARAEREERKRASQAEREQQKETARAEREEQKRAAKARREAQKQAAQAEKEERKRAAKAAREEKRQTSGGEKKRIPKALYVILAIVLLAAAVAGALIYIGSRGGSTVTDNGTDGTAAGSETADYTLTLEDFISSNETAKEQLLGSTDGTDVSISVSENTLIYTYDLGASDNMTEEIAHSDQIKSVLTDTLDSNDTRFIELCEGLETDTGISGLSVEVIYTYEGEVIMSRRYTSSGKE